MPSEDTEFVVQMIERGVYWCVEKPGLESLAGPAQTAFLLWRTRELVGNGGMAGFHHGNLDVSAVVATFEEFGFADAATAIRGSLSFFPAEVAAGAPHELSGWLIHIYHETEEDPEDAMEKVEDFFQPYTDVVMQLEPDGEFGARIAAYIRAHPEAFSEIVIHEDFNSVPLHTLRRWPDRRVAMPQ